MKQEDSHGRALLPCFAVEHVNTVVYRDSTDVGDRDSEIGHIGHGY